MPAGLRAKVNVGMVGTTSDSRADRLLHFRRWKKSGFGDLNQHGPDSIRFYTKTKTVTRAGPRLKEGAEFSIRTMN